MNLFKRSNGTSSSSKSVVGRSPIWPSPQFSLRQYGLVAIGLLVLAGGILLFAATPSPFASLTADQGTLTCGASTVPDSTASDGKGYVQFGQCNSGSGTTYYVSPTGSDSNNGTSPSSPWQTVSKVDNFCPKPGDTILFQGGQTFSGTDLEPPCSGVSGDSITYASYGSGRAILTDVWLPTGNHDLVFNDLELTSNHQLFSACAGCNLPHYNITLENSYLHNTNNLGVHTVPLDHNWLIEGNTIEHTGDSGILVEYSSNITTTHNTVLYTGEDQASIGYPTHGIYAKGPDETISYNDFSHDLGGQAISVRTHGDYIYGNTIHDTNVAFSFFDYDLAAAPQGASYIYGNKAWNISSYIFYYSNQANPNGQPPTVSFVFANNSFALTSNGSAGQAFNLSDVPANASVTLANNITTGSYGAAYAGCSSCSEYNNDWYGGTSSIPNGKNDQFVNPNLSAAPALALPAGSPLINSGTVNVPGLTYSQSSDGQPLHYAGSAPDIGAVEYTNP